jgi:hypothetical protein
VAATAAGLPVSDMLESAEYPAPEGWDAALAFGLDALRLLPRSKISVAADRVAITAIADSETRNAAGNWTSRAASRRGWRSRSTSRPPARC